MSTQFVCDAPGCDNVDDLDVTDQHEAGGFYCSAHQPEEEADLAYASTLESYDPDEHEVFNR